MPEEPKNDVLALTFFNLPLAPLPAIPPINATVFSLNVSVLTVLTFVISPLFLPTRPPIKNAALLFGPSLNDIACNFETSSTVSALVLPNKNLSAGL